MLMRLEGQRWQDHTIIQTQGTNHRLTWKLQSNAKTVGTPDWRSSHDNTDDWLQCRM